MGPGAVEDSKEEQSIWLERRPNSPLAWLLWTNSLATFLLRQRALAAIKLHDHNRRLGKRIARRRGDVEEEQR